EVDSGTISRSVNVEVEKTVLAPLATTTPITWSPCWSSPVFGLWPPPLRIRTHFTKVPGMVSSCRAGLQALRFSLQGVRTRAIVVTETQLFSEHDGSIAVDQYAIRQMPSNTPCKCEPLTIATESHEILRCVEVLYANYLLIDDRPGI